MIYIFDDYFIYAKIVLIIVSIPHEINIYLIFVMFYLLIIFIQDNLISIRFIHTINR